MANNYCESSSFLDLDKDKLERAKEIVERVIASIEGEDDEGLPEDYFGVEVDFEDSGIWFHHDESINTDNLEVLVKALLEELEIDEPFTFSWAYTCSKPRIDEFGGGACVVQRGQESVWVDATTTAIELMKKQKEKSDDLSEDMQLAVSFLQDMRNGDMPDIDWHDVDELIEKYT